MFNWLKSLFGNASGSRIVPFIPLPHTDEEKDAFIERYLKVLVENGWMLEKSTSPLSCEEICKKISEEFSSLDTDLLRFLSSFKMLINKTQNVWYVELEPNLDSLQEGVANLLNTEINEEDSSFWDNHFPIMNSLVIEDSTISVVLHGKDKGKFVYCNENIYDDAEIIADDFYSFLQLHAHSVELGADTYKDNKLWAFV